MLAGRPHEAASNGSPRWMAAGQLRLVHRTRPTGRLARRLTGGEVAFPVAQPESGSSDAARAATSSTQPHEVLADDPGPLSHRRSLLVPRHADFTPFAHSFHVLLCGPGFLPAECPVNRGFRPARIGSRE